MFLKKGIQVGVNEGRMYHSLFTLLSYYTLHSCYDCKFCDETGGILLSILWMSYFLRPHLISLLEARENRFSTEERANFDQFHRKIYIIAEALPVVDVGVALLLLLPPYGPPPPPVVVEEPQAAMRSARARLI